MAQSSDTPSDISNSSNIPNLTNPSTSNVSVEMFFLEYYDEQVKLIIFHSSLLS